MRLPREKLHLLMIDPYFRKINKYNPQFCVPPLFAQYNALFCQVWQLSYWKIWQQSGVCTERYLWNNERTFCRWKDEPWTNPQSVLKGFIPPDLFSSFLLMKKWFRQESDLDNEKLIGVADSVILSLLSNSDTGAHNNANRHHCIWPGSKRKKIEAQAISRLATFLKSKAWGFLYETDHIRRGSRVSEDIQKFPKKFRRDLT